MPKFKGKQTRRGDWDENAMKQAILCVREKKISIREAADKYGVPRSTLQDRLKAISRGQEVNLQAKLGRFDNTFTEEQSQQLYNHIKDLDNRLMPLTRVEFLKLAFQFAEKLKISHRFNKEKKMAGKDFFYSFSKKYPDIVLRTPESTSIARAVGFNKPQVDRFYDQLDQLLQKYKFPPSKIYNADETGVSTVHKNEKVISVKGKKQVGKLTSNERGRNITLMFAMSVTGHFVPPLFIFPRKRMDRNGRLMIGAPPESIAIPHKSGWMNGDIFLQWLQHFKQHTQPSKEHPVLLILDGHGSHKELAVIEYARANNIHMLSTPPHTTHKLQPLDRVFFKPFKSAYASACALWIRSNSCARISDFDVAALVNSAFSKAARLDIAQSGFKCSGIYPFNRDIFTELDFLPSQMTNVEEDPVLNENLSCNITAVISQLTTSRCDLLPAQVTTHQISSEISNQQSATATSQPSTSGFGLSASVIMQPTNNENSYQQYTAAISQPSTSSNQQSASVSFDSSHPSINPHKQTDVSPNASYQLLKQLSPLPDASRKRLQFRRRKAQRSEILTSSPYKNTLVEKAIDTKKKTATAIGVKKKNTTAKSATNKKKPALKTKRNIQNLTRDEETECIICGETFEEDWIQCDKCKDWAHEACVYIDEAQIYYYCDVCTAKETIGHH